MNYYEHHLGDYMRDTAHLSILEDGVYRRLLDAYYAREAPLPTDLRECCKLARAVSKPERDAVGYVLREFFSLSDDGYRQSRADREIARFQAKQAKAKSSANARWSHASRTTERNANASEIDANAHANASSNNANALPTQSERNANGMHRAPVPSNQTPNPKEKPIGRAVAVNPATVLPETTAPPLGRHEQFQRLRGAPVAMIPTDWQPSDTVRMRLVTAGCRQMEPEDVIRFVSHFTATAEALADWDARAVNWMLDQRRIDQRTPQRNGGGEAKTSEQILAEFQAMVAEDDAGEMQGARHAQR